MKKNLSKLFAACSVFALMPMLAQAQVPISQLPSATIPLNGTEIVSGVQGTQTVKFPTYQLLNPYISIGGGNITLGTITGTTQCLHVNSAGVLSGTGSDCGSGGGGAVSSVFTRTGAVTAQSGDYTFAQIGSTPTSLSGYGIADGVSLTGTQTLTNKTLTAPVMTAPVLGTIASGVGTTLTALNASNITSGTIPSAQLPLGSSSVFGAVKVDNTTITASAGVISAVGGGSGNALFGTTTGNIANDAVCMSNTTVGVKDCTFAPAPAGQTVIVTTSQTPNAADFGVCKFFIMNNSSLSLTVPASSSLQANGGCYEIQTLANTSSLIANAADTITFPGGTTSGTGATVTLPANKLYRVSTDGAGKLYVSQNTVTGTGADARAISPTFTTPVLGAATATTINGVTIPSVTDTVMLLGQRQTVTAEINNAVTALTISSTTFTPTGASNNYYIHLTAACASAACTLANPSAGFANPGQSGVIEVQQPSSGGPAAFGTYGTSYIFQGATSTMTYSTGASASDLWSYNVRNDGKIVLTIGSQNPTH